MFHHLHELDDIPARLQKRDQGREEGREEGLESGVEIGVDKSIRQTARNLLQMNMVSDSQIAEAAGLTVAEVKPLRREWIGFAYSAKSQYGLLVFQPQSPYPTL